MLYQKRKVKLLPFTCTAQRCCDHLSVLTSPPWTYAQMVSKEEKIAYRHWGFQEMHYPYACSFSTPSFLLFPPCIFWGSSESCPAESVYHTLFSARSTRKRRVLMRSAITLTWQKSQSACSFSVYAQSAIEERIILTTSSDHYWKLPLTLYCNRRCFIKCHVWGKLSGVYRPWFMLKWKESS